MTIQVIKELDLFIKQGIGQSVCVMLGGLCEPPSGYFYIWKDLGDQLVKKLGLSAVYPTLAGCGNSSQMASFELWHEKLELIKEYFKDKSLIFITRGLSVCLLDDNDQAIVIEPPCPETLDKLLPSLRWTSSHIFPHLLTPAFPQALTDDEKKFFHMLGSEAECIGGFEIDKSFLNNIPREVSKINISHRPVLKASHHPLFDKWEDRALLFDKICKLLQGTS